jgi:hypothetical protein
VQHRNWRPGRKIKCGDRNLAGSKTGGKTNTRLARTNNRGESSLGEQEFERVKATPQGETQILRYQINRSENEQHKPDPKADIFIKIQTRLHLK